MVAISKPLVEQESMPAAGSASGSQSIALLRLLQLCSVNMPVGAYTFSQGLETAVDQGWLTDDQETCDWLEQLLARSIALCDLPVLRRQLSALDAEDMSGYMYWNAFILACRETSEFRLTDTATGKALMRVLTNLDVDDFGKGIEIPERTLDGKKQDFSFVSAFALAAHHWGIAEEDACLGYAWAWLENQIAAATKLVPLGQTQAQQLLQRLQPPIAEAVERSQRCEDFEIGSSMPALAIASSWHEHQYSRLFRS